MKAAHALVAQRIKTRQERAKQQAAQRLLDMAHKRKLEVISFFLQTHFHDAVAFAGLILFTVLLSLRMDLVIEWSWHYVALPLYAAVGV